MIFFIVLVKYFFLRQTAHSTKSTAITERDTNTWCEGLQWWSLCKVAVGCHC